MDIEKNLKKEITTAGIQSIRGWILWHSICKKYKQKDYLVVCIPNIQSEYSKFAFLYLDDLLRARGYEKAIIITEQSEKVKEFKNFSMRILDVIFYTQEELQNIQKFYALCNLDGRFVLATLNVPYGKNIDNIKTIEGFSYEEAFAYGVYRIKPYSKYISKELQQRGKEA